MHRRALLRKYLNDELKRSVELKIEEFKEQISQSEEKIKQLEEENKKLEGLKEVTQKQREEFEQDMKEKQMEYKERVDEVIKSSEEEKKEHNQEKLDLISQKDKLEDFVLWKIKGINSEFKGEEASKEEDVKRGKLNIMLYELLHEFYSAARIRFGAIFIVSNLFIAMIRFD